jgi:hypothetical protein
MLDRERSKSLSKMARFIRTGDGTPQEPLTQANYEKWPPEAWGGEDLR